MRKIAFILGFVIVGTLSEAWTPMDTEEVDFHGGRCMEDHFKQDFDLVKKWSKGDFPEGDDKTPCFVKCLVESFGIYDGQSKKFQPDRVKQQFEAFKQFNGLPNADDIVKGLEGLDAKDGDCKSIASAFIPFNKANVANMQKIFLLEPGVRDKVIKDNPQIKPNGVSVFRFCGKQFYEEGEAAYCKVRKHGYSDDPKFIKHSNCTTRGIRWMKKNGEMDEAEIKRDLHVIGETGKDDVVTKSIGECKAKDESKARDYYKCLYDGLGEELFMKVLDYIEVRTQNRMYRLRKETAEYKPEEMRNKVKQLDTEAKCA